MTCTFRAEPRFLMLLFGWDFWLSFSQVIGGLCFLNKESLDGWGTFLILDRGANIQFIYKWACNGSLFGWCEFLRKIIILAYNTTYYVKLTSSYKYYQTSTKSNLHSSWQNLWNFTFIIHSNELINTIHVFSFVSMFLLITLFINSSQMGPLAIIIIIVI